MKRIIKYCGWLLLVFPLGIYAQNGTEKETTPDPIAVVNGYIVRYSEIIRLKPEYIATFTELDGEDAVKLFGNRAKGGAVVIKLVGRNSAGVGEKVDEELLTRAEQIAMAKQEAEAERQRLAEEKRLADAEAERQRLAEEKRLADAEAERQRLAEEKRLADAEAERQRLAEEKRLADAEAERQRLAEEKRLADAEAERQRLAEEKRLADAEAERQRLAEEKRLADAEAERQRLAEEKRLADAEAERQRLAEEKRLADLEAERQRLAEEKAKELVKEKESVVITEQEETDESYFSPDFISQLQNDFEKSVTDPKVKRVVVNGQEVSKEEALKINVFDVETSIVTYNTDKTESVLEIRLSNKR